MMCLAAVAGDDLVLPQVPDCSYLRINTKYDENIANLSNHDPNIPEIIILKEHHMLLQNLTMGYGTFQSNTHYLVVDCLNIVLHHE